MTAVLDSLRAKIKQHESQAFASHGLLPFGVKEIDDHLPDHGLAMGAFHEVASGGNAAQHAAAATLFTAGLMARTKGPILWCLKQKDLFAPGLGFAGLNVDRIIFVEAGDEPSVLACFEEGLRHGGVAGVVAEVSKLTMTASRRLQLAAESTGALGMAIWRGRGEASAKEWSQSTAARTRWRVTARPSNLLPVAGLSQARWHLELLRCRGGESARFDVKACNEKGYLTLSSDLAYRPLETVAGKLRTAS